MASQRQAHNRKRQKAILVMAVALLIIVVIAIIGPVSYTHLVWRHRIPRGYYRIPCS